MPKPHRLVDHHHVEIAGQAQVLHSIVEHHDLRAVLVLRPLREGRAIRAHQHQRLGTAAGDQQRLVAHVLHPGPGAPCSRTWT